MVNIQSDIYDLLLWQRLSKDIYRRCLHSNYFLIPQGRSQDFSKGAGSHGDETVEVSHQIFMSFLPPVIGCLLQKTWLTKEGSRARQDPPGYAPVPIIISSIITSTYKALLLIILIILIIRSIFLFST